MRRACVAIAASLMPGIPGVASAAPLAPGFAATAQSPLATGTAPAAVVADGFDGDAIPDVAFANAGDGITAGSVTSRAGSATGIFSASVSTIAVGIAPAAMVSGYFNTGVYRDLIVANRGGNSVTTLLGNGTGTFPTSRTTSVGRSPSAIAAGDLNQDGSADLVVANGGDASVSVLRAQGGSGRFTGFNCTKCANTVSTGASPSAVALADVNGDGFLDLLATDASNTLTLRPGAGDGSFGGATSKAVDSNPTAIGVGDLNGDGIADVVVVNQGSGTLSVFTGSSAGALAAQPSITLPASSAPAAIAVADLNGDRIADIAVALSGAAGVGILAGNGDATFAATGTLPVGTTPSSIAAADINGDGRPDLIVTNRGANSATVLLNTTAALLTVTAPSSIDFGMLAVGATANPVELSVVVSSTAPAGYQLSVSRSAFSQADIPQSVSLTGVPVGATRTLTAGTTQLPQDASVALGERRGSSTPIGGDTWGLATGLGPIPFGIEGTRTSTITYTVVALP